MIVPQPSVHVLSTYQHDRLADGQTMITTYSIMKYVTCAHWLLSKLNDKTVVFAI